MSQISKCPNITVVLTYWEASGEVSEPRYKSLLYFSSKRSYCSTIADAAADFIGNGFFNLFYTLSHFLASTAFKSFTHHGLRNEVWTVDT